MLHVDENRSVIGADYHNKPAVDYPLDPMYLQTTRSTHTIIIILVLQSLHSLFLVSVHITIQNLDTVLTGC